MKQISRIWKGKQRGWDVLKVLQDSKGNVSMPHNFVKENPTSANPLKQKNGMALLKKALKNI